MRRSMLIAGMAALLGAAPLAARAQNAAASPSPSPSPSANANADGSADAPEAKHYSLRADVEYRQLAITDSDPVNDLGMTYRARADYKLERVVPGLKVFVQTGIGQKFYAEPDESGLLLEDTLVGAGYAHSVGLEVGGVSRDLDLAHSMRIYVPTSRASHNRELYTAIDYMVSGRVRTIGKLSVGLDLRGRYHINGHAEAQGPDGAELTMLFWSGNLAAEYVVLESSSFGDLSLGADLASYHRLKYPLYGYWYLNQQVGWDAYAAYSPFKHLSMQLSIEHNSSVLRNGIVNLALFNRDMIEVALTVTGTY